MDKDLLEKIRKHLLVRWLHIVEENKTKRIGGLVFELCFTEYLTSRLMPSLNFRQISHGWFYTTIAEDKNDIRFWFRLGTELSETDELFIRKLSGLGHRFFSITYDLLATGTNVIEQKRPALSCHVAEIVSSRGSMNIQETAASENMAGQINRRINRAIGAKQAQRFHRPILLPFLEWFQNQSVQVLKNLFVTRVLMNFGLAAPVDTDAIALSKNGRLVLVEFKRKNPAKVAMRMGGKVPAERYAQLAIEIDSLISHHHLDSESAKSLFDEELKKKGLVWSGPGCFGLDLSHYETVKLCQTAGMDYVYLIWDWTAEKESKNVDPVEDLNNVLDSALAPRTWPLLKIGSLLPDSISGLTRTVGDDSGSFNRKLRVQVVINDDAACFNTIPEVS